MHVTHRVTTIAIGLTVLAVGVGLSPLLGIPLLQSIVGTVTLYGCWFEGGWWICRRLSLPGRHLAVLGPVLGVAEWALLCGVFALLQADVLFTLLQYSAGAILASLGVVRGLRLKTDVHLGREEVAMMACAIAASLATGYYTYPNFVIDAVGQLTMTGYYTTDGLWFAGNAAAVTQGLPLLDYRLVGQILYYQYLSLALAHSTSAVLQCREVMGLFYVVIPLLVGLTAALCGAIVKALRPVERITSWVVLAALAGTFLTDGSSLLSFLGGSPRSLVDFLTSVPTSTMLGNKHNIWMLLDPPFTMAVVLGLGGLYAWLVVLPHRPIAGGAVVGGLFFLGGLSKAVLVPILLPGVGLLGIAVFVRWLRRREPGARALLIGYLLIGGCLLAGVGVSRFLQTRASYASFQFSPWYLVDFVDHYAQVLVQWEDWMPYGSRLAMALLWLLPALGWQLLGFVPLRQAPTGHPQFLVMSSLVVGLIVANTFSAETLWGAELYFSGLALALVPPFACGGLARCWKRSRILGVVLILPFVVGLLGASHFFTGRPGSHHSAFRLVSRSQVEVLEWLRTQTAPDAVILYFRTGLTDGVGPERLTPGHDQYYRISGLAERPTVSEGSYYGGLYRLPGLRELREEIARFYGRQMSPEEASAFLSRHGIDYVLSERSIDLSPYHDLLFLVRASDRYLVYLVAPGP